MFFFSPSPQHSIPRSVWKALERDLHCISPKSLKRAKMIHHYAWSGKSFSPKNAAREKCLFLYVVWLVINEKVSLNIILISAAISLSEAFMFCLRHKPLNEGLWFQVGNQQVWVICPQTVSSGTRLTLLGDKNCCGWSVVCGAEHLLPPVQPLFEAYHVARANHSASLCQLPFLWKAALMQFSCHADELTAQTNLGLIDCRLKELVTDINWLIPQFRS